MLLLEERGGGGKTIEVSVFFPTLTKAPAKHRPEYLTGDGGVVGGGWWYTSDHKNTQPSHLATLAPALLLWNEKVNSTNDVSNEFLVKRSRRYR